MKPRCKAAHLRHTACTPRFWFIPEVEHTGGLYLSLCSHWLLLDWLHYCLIWFGSKAGSGLCFHTFAGPAPTSPPSKAVRTTSTQTKKDLPFWHRLLVAVLPLSHSHSLLREKYSLATPYAPRRDIRAGGMLNRAAQHARASRWTRADRDGTATNRACPLAPTSRMNMKDSSHVARFPPSSWTLVLTFVPARPTHSFR